MNISNPSTINLTAVEPSVTRSKSMETTDVDPESDSDASGLFEMFGRLLDSQLSDSQLPGSQLEGEPLESAVDTAPDSQITPEDIADSVIDNVISIAITPEVQTHHLSGQASLVTDPLTALADKVLQNGPNLTLMNPSLQKQSSGNDLPGGGNISSEDLFFLNEGISAQAKFNPDNNEILSLRPRQIESLFSAPVPQQGNNLNVQATPLPYALAASTTADHTTLTGTQTLASNTGFTIESAVGSDN
ncbi:hypothetical protein JYU22_05005, partial [Gammaproteobacteria bacterium AH-315-E17]|nr:hypothetical protein [Gammaproteobacteria bacterium AH-315-E17]